MAITVYRGDDVRLVGQVLDQDETPIDITGWTIVFSAATAKGTPPIFQITADLSNPTAGAFHIHLSTD